VFFFLFPDNRQSWQVVGTHAGRHASRQARNKGDLELTPAFFTAIETGVKWTLSAKFSLYTGLYLDYGVNNIWTQPSQEQKLIPYNTLNPPDYRPNSALVSSVHGIPLADRIMPLAAGIKIGLAFDTK
jgi:hypothetical protein